MKKYSLELYFYKEESIFNGEGLDESPRFDEYSGVTELLSITTWESYKNEILRTHPEVAFIKILNIENIGIVTDYEDESYENDFLIIGESKIHGQGIFAKNNLQKEEKVLSLDGDIVQMEDTYPSGEWNALSEGMFLTRKKRTIYGYINHSRNPNCKIDFSNFIIVTLREIEEGEEITIDYREEPLPIDYLLGFGSTYL